MVLCTRLARLATFNKLASCHFCCVSVLGDEISVFWQCNYS
jgi:hypothetical protein